MIRFEDLLEKVRDYNPDGDVELLRRAYVFSALEHKGQVRHSGEPYLVHPLEVATILAEMKMDAVTIAAGLLHDVVEDTLTTTERIQQTFGAEVAHLVEGVTKISAITFSSSEERQAENFRKMLLAMVDDIRVILVKLADRLHNMRTLSFLSEERRLRIAQETLDIYAPIANRLGMSKVKNELEELAFRFLEPEAYDALKARVERRRKASEGIVDDLRRTVIGKLQEAQVPVVTVDGRTKRLYSIHQKLRRQKIDLDRVYDFMALRIVTKTIRDCYAALGIIHQTWSPVPGRIKDFIAMPRPNGYQSLHTSVISEDGFPFEVQIRTEEMHLRAEEGIAAHWKYKEGRVGAERDEPYFVWLRQLLEWQQEVHDPQEFIQHLKIDLYPEEVYTFTPKGQVKPLPRGATPVDFAYTIHTDVGHQCVGARVNGRMVPLRTPLKNGDIVEIVTQKNHRPSRDWLNFVATSRARNKIKQSLEAEEKVRAIEVGRKLLEKEARRFELSMRLLDEAELQKAAGQLGMQKGDEVLAAVGLRQAAGAAGPRQAGARRAAHREARRRRVDGPARAGARRRQDQGARRRRPPRRARPLLQPDSRREDRRLHHAGQGRLRPFRELPERDQPALHARSPHRRRVGPRLGGRGLHGGSPGERGGPEGAARGDQLEDRRRQHQHHQHRGEDARRPPRSHQHDARDPRFQAPREGAQVAAQGVGGAGGGTGVRRGN